MEGLKKAKVNFKFENGRYWNVTIADKKSKKVIYKTRMDLGIEGYLSTAEKLKRVKNVLGSLLDSKGYFLEEP